MLEGRELRELNISDVLPNRFQPRLKFEQESLDQLAESISKFGVIEPVVVRPVGNKFEIVAGERRYKASKLASKSTIPAIVINLSDKDSEELALLENVQRKALNPIEEAVSYKRILDAGYINREELAKKIGKSQTEIFNKIRLLSLSDEVQSYLLNGKISERHARSLLKIENLDNQTEMLHRIVNERLTVKQTDREIRKILENNEIKVDNVEVLSFEERGNEKMDIDKIMREAQDINQVPQETTANMPDLMAKNNDVQSEPIVRNDISENNVNISDDNKFIGQPPIDVTPSPQVQVENDNFNNVFNGPLNVDSSNLPFNEPVQPVAPEPMPTVDPVNMAAPAFEAGLNPSSQQEISNAVSNAFNNYNTSNETSLPGIVENSKFINVPDTNILQDNVTGENATSNVIQSGVTPEPMTAVDSVQPVAPEPMPTVDPIQPVAPEPMPTVDPIQPVAPEPMPTVDPVQPVAPEPMPTNDFSKIVQMLRDCANQIEKNGHFVNMDELDLGNQYRVTITIDK